jgi:DNA helicase II / ATP-dependent DNA helicase PcrA
MKPTKEQEAVIGHEQGRAVVFAVAGSGKTSTVVKRINRLVGEAGYRPERILATTFSRAAKAQLDFKLKSEEFCKEVKSQTLHALALRIVKFRSELLGVPQRAIADEDKLTRCFYAAKDRLREGNGINHREVALDQQKIEEIGSEDFFNYLMQLKGDLLATEWWHDQLPQRAKPFFDVEGFTNSYWLEALVNTYEDERRNGRYLGFDDIMVAATIILGSDNEIRESFSAQFEFIFVDEYQDVNKAQDKMLHLLDERSHNMMVIGDDDQTIYEWRGARPEIIRSKLTDSSWKSFKLSRNFRSSPGPVVLASQCIIRNVNRAPKKMLPMRQFSGVLDIRHFATPSDQAKAVVEVIQDNHQKFGDYSSAVILIRQFAETPLIEQELISAGIRYDIPGSSPFYFRRETKYILDYLELFILENKRRLSPLNGDESDKYSKALGRIYTRPKTFMRRVDLMEIIGQLLADRTITLAELLDNYNEQKVSNGQRRSEGVDDLITLFTSVAAFSMNQLRAGDAIAMIDKHTKLRQWIIESAVHAKLGRIRAQIIPALIDYAEEDSVEKFIQNIDQLKEFNAEGVRGNDDSRVKILTVFRSKGLEFPTVVIPNMNSAESEVAPINAVAASPRDHAAMEEEERRILYVAMTRAINDLHIYFTTSNPSAYLTEARYMVVKGDMAEMELFFKGDINRFAHQDPTNLVNFIVRAKRYQIGNACAKAWARELDDDRGKHVYECLSNILQQHCNAEQSRIDAAIDYLDKIYVNSVGMRSRLAEEPLQDEQIMGDGNVLEELPEDDGDFE